ncbi:phosphatidylinositol 3-kinase regulatory subunit gamma-like isoform X2 [Paramacrobiotus metropolitanus]|uniref:phosphatidylinositol 3-kinase regulatory subunit gamma-like isoform X2 n=1 Tax=Paramacrobiotus metropolitanus TaxID=2943436 RepID=UPI00244596BA|nr:phosphatidylinositol 3-kinase regulatory subunit gamma-like isoform X2 [Paramacrobiotus metropolitanus]
MVLDAPAVHDRLKTENYLGTLASGSLCDSCKHLMHGSLICGSCPCQLGVGHSCQRSCSTRLEKRCTACALAESCLARRVFGVELSQQLLSDEPVPALVARCVEEIEKRASAATHDLNRIFSLTVPADVVRIVCEQISLSGDLNLLSACEIACIVEVLKRYLLELPTPVIPTSMYDMFIEATSLCETEDQRASIILDLAKKLPDAHAKTLRYLMGHFCRLCSMIKQSEKKCNPTLLLQPLAVGLIRPSWLKTELISRHINWYNVILETLLLKGTWGIDLCIADLDFGVPSGLPEIASLTSEFARRNSIGARGLASSPKNLEDCDWYWGSVSRDDAAAAMKDQPDGSFLVRASSTKVQGEYTLTLRKEGANKLIRIIGRDGKYGFAEPLEFDSVQAVIDYHRTNSLAPYNRMLDICLISPLSKNQGVIDSSDRDKILQQLKENNMEYNMWSEIYDRLTEETTRTAQEVNMKTQAMAAFDAAVLMFEEQIKIHERYQRDAKPNEIDAVKANYALLKARLDGILSNRAKLQVDLNLQTQWLKTKENDLANIKPRITHLNIVRGDMIKLLTRSGVNQGELDEILQESAKLGEKKGSERLKSSPVSETILEVPATSEMVQNDEKMWYIPDATREQAEKLLINKPSGTFLIRRRMEGSSGQTHALSVMVNGKVGHCLINQNENAFGFAAPTGEFVTLRDLVSHYAKKSLKEHNPQLNVTLAYPVNAPGTSS